MPAHNLVLDKHYSPNKQETNKAITLYSSFGQIEDAKTDPEVLQF